MENRRLYFRSFRCAWCERVGTRRTWLPERRDPGENLYAYGICVSCLVEHLDGSLEGFKVRVRKGQLRRNAFPMNLP
jgi:hypothetical protein